MTMTRAGEARAERSRFYYGRLLTAAKFVAAMYEEGRSGRSAKQQARLEEERRKLEAASAEDRLWVARALDEESYQLAVHWKVVPELPGRPLDS